MSLSVQALPSVHDAVFGFWMQPFLVSHESSVQDCRVTRL
jgi:hypothetical protein